MWAARQALISLCEVTVLSRLCQEYVQRFSLWIGSVENADHQVPSSESTSEFGIAEESPAPTAICTGQTLTEHRVLGEHRAQV